MQIAEADPGSPALAAIGVLVRRARELQNLAFM